MLSKAERGYRLLGPAPGAIKASTIPLTSDLNAALALERIAAAGVRRFRLNEIALGWSRDATEAHDATSSTRSVSRFLELNGSMQWLPTSAATTAM